MMSAFHSAVEAHRTVLDEMSALEAPLQILASEICVRLRAGGKLLLCGNGGSATDADHIAAEFVGRFQRERSALPAMSLATSPAGITAVANDYGFDRVFERFVRGFGTSGDVLIGITTSGRSPNVLAACRAGREQGLFVSGWTGIEPRDLAEVSEHLLCVPSHVTARIQEMHILLGHILCDIVESTLFGDECGGK